MIRRLDRKVVILWTVICIMACQAIIAQQTSETVAEAVSSLSASQIQALQQLSPAEQAALAEQVGRVSPTMEGEAEQAADSEADEVDRTQAETETVDEYSRVLYPGAPALRKFGYDIFSGSPSTFAPVDKIPVPANYVLGPGDVLDVHLMRQLGGRYRLTVNRDGQVELPEIGPVMVSGLRFPEVKASIEETVATLLPGTRTTVSLAELRSIQIFVLGEARRAGAYTVSGLSTISNAVMTSGGVTNLGSLRRIELRREGALVTILDLYDFLLKGDTSKDQRLLPGDVIFIPTIENFVGVAGAVNRPAIYELTTDATVAELIDLAGGLQVSADPARGILNRQEGASGRTVRAVDLRSLDDRRLTLQTGDFLQIESALPILTGQVVLNGHVFRPGGKPWRSGMRLTDLLPSIEELQVAPDLDYVLVASRNPITGELSARSASLREAWLDVSSGQNIELASGDQVFVFSQGRPRSTLIEPILAVLRGQASAERPFSLVSITGAVKAEGNYPFEETMTVAALIRAAGGLAPAPDLDYVLIGRTDPATRVVSVTSVSIREQQGLDTVLSAGDRVIIFNEKDSRSALIAPIVAALRGQSAADTPYRLVTVSGAVQSPGSYPFQENMTVRELIRAGGGLNLNAYSLQAELIRYVVGPDQVRRREIIAIPLTETFNDQPDLDFLIQPFDELTIQVIPDWAARATVRLDGEVVFPGTYSIEPGDTLRSVIERAGGLKKTAFAQGAFFSRQALRARELEQMRRLQMELRRDVIAQQNQLIAAGEAEAANSLSSVLELSLELVDDNPALGRLSIDLPRVMAGETYGRSDLLLRDGDRLFIPTRPDEVSVIGEVFLPSSHVYERGRSVSDYVTYAGGARSTSDLSGIYVVSASGRARPVRAGGWRGGSSGVLPGDTIVVPLKVPKLRDPLLATVSEVTQIIYQLALGAAAVQTFRN